DLRGGKAVRLLQGDYAQETVYGDDPVALAESFAAAGAKWIHVVDLDAARTGDPINRPVVAAVAAAVRGRAKVQTGGGVRSVADAEALAAAGVARVVMGSAAVKDRTLVASVFRIVPVAVGLDHRDGDVALHGWTQGSGLNVMDLLDCYPDAEAFIITNIARDGMLAGPDIDGLAAAAAASPIPVIASGGVSSLDDLRMLNRVPGLAGVITGKAIYENRFTVGEALETLAEPS
ncbi:MAG: 1-(5-phosphoribosyl)-5-((5-phosphoribosylamino)methylideneamino)imidazole-4-carboxamide isomerase, partial [Actinobacteria bacterium]|nr:1-(5-phosphoribosyl)-5-((5-phosphoribosylamino)methylideneamino)imidazole-4-carboxamide isomerase [Actinomycetota bacterium]